MQGGRPASCIPRALDPRPGGDVSPPPPGPPPPAPLAPAQAPHHQLQQLHEVLAQALAARHALQLHLVAVRHRVALLQLVASGGKGWR